MPNARLCACYGQYGDIPMRYVFTALLLVAAGPLLAFFERPAGYNMEERIQSGGTGGITWDPAPAATDFYASHDGGIRRYDTTLEDFAATRLFDAPTSVPPAGYAFFDSLAIDPANPDDFFVSYSGNFSRLYRLNRTGPDSATVVTELSYDDQTSTDGLFISQLVFVPDLPTVPANLRGELIAAGAEGFGAPARIYHIDRTTLEATPIIEVGHSNGSGPTAVDADGNIYTAEPMGFGHAAASRAWRFDAAAVSAAVGGGPVATTADGEVVIGENGDVWNITGLAVRDEDGARFAYFGTYERASIYRHALETGETRVFIQGYGGVTDGFLHFARSGSLSFSSSADEFAPASGGDVTLVVPYSVSTPGSSWAAVHQALYFFTPEPVNSAVDSLVITDQPTAINDGQALSFSLQALNNSGSPLLSSVALRASLTTGVGELAGFTLVAGPGDAFDFSGLAYTGAAVPESITVRFEVSGAPGVFIDSAPIDVVAPATGLEVIEPTDELEDGKSFSIQVRVVDAGGNIVTGGQDASREVSVTLQSGSGTLYGGGAVQAVNGVATFSALLIEGAGPHTLEFHSNGLTPDASSLDIAERSGGGSSSSSDNGGCIVGGGGSAAVLFLLAAVLFGRRRFMRKGISRS
jgi:uncharacterized protein (TIGR03382 family)